MKKAYYPQTARTETNDHLSHRQAIAQKPIDCSFKYQFGQRA